MEDTEMCKTSRPPWWQFDPQQAFRVCSSAPIVAVVVGVGGGPPAPSARGQGVAGVGPGARGNGSPQFYQDGRGKNPAPSLDTGAAAPCALAETFPNPA